MAMMTYEQRRQLCAQYRMNPHMTQTQLALWAQRNFNLPKPPTQPTISHILKRRHEYEQMRSEDLNAKRQRSVRFPALDTALVNWLYHCQAKQVRLVGETIREKANTLANLMGLGPERPQFSNGWLQSFQTRHGFASSRKPQYRGAMPEVKSPSNANGESLSPATMLESKEAIEEALRNVEPENIYAMAEMCLFYAICPDKSSVNEENIPNQHRFTVVVAVNATGGDKMDPFFVCDTLPYVSVSEGSGGDASGDAQTRKRRMSGESDAIPFKTSYAHTANKKAWFTTSVFRDWLRSFDSQMRLRKRQVVLLMQSTMTYNTSNLELTNVKLYMFPSTPTAHPLLESMIIPCKRRYRAAQFNHVLEKKDKPRSFEVDPVQAMEWVDRSWREVSPGLIKRAFQAAGVQLQLGPNVEDANEAAVDLAIETCLQLMELKTPMTLEEILHCEAEKRALAREATNMSDQDFVDSATISSDLSTRYPRQNFDYMHYSPAPTPKRHARGSDMGDARTLMSGQLGNGGSSSIQSGVPSVGEDVQALQRVIVLAIQNSCSQSTINELMQLQLQLAPNPVVEQPTSSPESKGPKPSPSGSVCKFNFSAAGKTTRSDV